MHRPGPIGIIFVALAVVFVGLTLRDALKSSGKLNIARKVWIRIALIFTAVGIGLNVIQLVLW